MKFKNIPVYYWWGGFWVAVLTVVMIWERPMLRFIGPIAFIAFIGYMIYVMLRTAPTISSKVKSEQPQSESIEK